jgi:hypothetical protein
LLISNRTHDFLSSLRAEDASFVFSKTKCQGSISMWKLTYQLKAVHQAAKQTVGRSLSPFMPRGSASPRAVAKTAAVFVLAAAAVTAANAVVFAQEELSASYSSIFAGIFGERYQGPGTARVLYTQSDPVNFLWGLTALGETFPLAARVHASVNSQPAYGQVVTSAFAEYGYAFKVVETEPPPWYASFGVPLQLHWKTVAELDDAAFSPVRTVHASAEVLFNQERVGISFRDSPGVDADAGFHYAWRQAN